MGASEGGKNSNRRETRWLMKARVIRGIPPTPPNAARSAPYFSWATQPTNGTLREKEYNKAQQHGASGTVLLNNQAGKREIERAREPLLRAMRFSYFSFFRSFPRRCHIDRSIDTREPTIPLCVCASLG